MENTILIIAEGIAVSNINTFLSNPLIKRIEEIISATVGESIILNPETIKE